MLRQMILLNNKKNILTYFHNSHIKLSDGNFKFNMFVDNPTHLNFDSNKKFVFNLFDILIPNEIKYPIIDTSQSSLFQCLNQKINYNDNNITILYNFDNFHIEKEMYQFINNYKLNPKNNLIIISVNNKLYEYCHDMNIRFYNIKNLL